MARSTLSPLNRLLVWCFCNHDLILPVCIWNTVTFGEQGNTAANNAKSLKLYQVGR